MHQITHLPLNNANLYQSEEHSNFSHVAFVLFIRVAYPILNAAIWNLLSSHYSTFLSRDIYEAD